MSAGPHKTRLLFVCLGNICRSPMAEGVFAHVAEQAGHRDRFILDSAGTSAWHAGEPPDPRAVSAAARRGIDLSAQRARQVEPSDFAGFDHILVMDPANRAALLEIAPKEHAHKITLLLERGVPDPYYGGENGFERALDLIEQGARSLLARLA